MIECESIKEIDGNNYNGDVCRSIGCENKIEYFFNENINGMKCLVSICEECAEKVMKEIHTNKINPDFLNCVFPKEIENQNCIGLCEEFTCMNEPNVLVKKNAYGMIFEVPLCEKHANASVDE